ncbi:aminoglycoside 6'-N-acetyltransferase I [Caulobacter ginsengisoli]|uniref:Aminoglycoside 6'-N-acetyltransferase I n=1 Tax=Caulobacter ginsengisoli TaxID=400775 RepID=A0ABU0IM10_9CAUL|nr:GNAT family N-acetyltransferase [Caulobacter ginsengisoli]MDQ0463042.1 aminoglycoside 6'-N-acetyltransferase I [Caulobacter ginsengisoli]
MAIEIRMLRAGDEATLARVADEVFDNPVDPDLTRQFLADPRHHIAVAIDDGLVVGFASGLDYVHPDKPAELWINEVGVAPSHQRQGLGRRVMKALFAEGRAKGCGTAWVLTDRSNTAARALYIALDGDEGVDEGPADAIVGYDFDLENG